MAGVMETELKKKDFLVAGLDLEFSGAAEFTLFNYIDTAMQLYNWQMETYVPVHHLGGGNGDSSVKQYD